MVIIVTNLHQHSGMQTFSFLFFFGFLTQIIKKETAMCLRNTNLDTGHRNPAHLLFKRGSQLEESRPEARVDLK